MLYYLAYAQSWEYLVALLQLVHNAGFLVGALSARASFVSTRVRRTNFELVSYIVKMPVSARCLSTHIARVEDSFVCV